MQKFQQNPMKIENKVKSLDFVSWKFVGQDNRHLEDLVKIFPYVEEFRMTNCTDSILRPDFHSNTFSKFLKYLRKISQWKNLKHISLKDTFFVESNYYRNNFDRDIRQVLDFVNNTFSIETKIEITFGKEWTTWGPDKSFMIAIVKEEGFEATLSPITT